MKINVVSNISIFQNLNADEMESIANMIQDKCYKKGELILRAGDEKKKLFIVKSGRVKVSKLLEDGNEQVLRIVNEADFFGATMFFQEEPLSVNVEAVCLTEIYVIEGEKLKAFLETSPSVLFKILETITKRMRLLENRLSAMSHKEVDSRVAKYLLDQVTGEDMTFKLVLSKKDLASLLDTTRESISRKLSEFQSKSFIQLEDNTITILDELSLQEIAWK